MDEIKDTDNDIDNNKLLLIGSSKKKFDFNIFKMPLNFLSNIYNDKISLKETEVLQKDLEKKVEELKFGYRPENAEENRVLMQTNNILEYRNKITEAFKDGTFLSEHLKKIR